MTQEIVNNLPTIQDLIAHMKEYKDAVIIIGDKIAPEAGKKFSSIVSYDEETEEEKILNRKVMAKEPQKFWDYYFENIYYEDKSIPDVYKDIYKIDEKDLVKKIISTDIRHYASTISDINLRGISTLIICSKCGHMLNKEEIDSMKESKEYKCPECGGRIKPQCLLYKENYYKKDTDAIKEAIFDETDPKLVLPNTHTLILFGVDIQEDYLLELYESFLAVKNNTEDTIYTVMVTDNSAEISLFKPEFSTTEDIDASISRLVNLIVD